MESRNEEKPSWTARNARTIAFAGGLIAIAIGCFFERVSLGFIVPGVVVCGMLIAGQVSHRRVSSGGNDGSA